MGMNRYIHGGCATRPQTDEGKGDNTVIADAQDATVPSGDVASTTFSPIGLAQSQTGGKGPSEAHLILGAVVIMAVLWFLERK